MAKARVYELAKELGVDSKTVLEKLKDIRVIHGGGPGRPQAEGGLPEGRRQ